MNPSPITDNGVYNASRDALHELSVKDDNGRVIDDVARDAIEVMDRVIEQEDGHDGS